MWSVRLNIARVCKDSRKGETFCTVLSTFGKGDANDGFFNSAANAHITSNKQLFLDTVEEVCRICPMRKQTKLPFPNNGSRAADVLLLLYSDISDPMKTNSIGGIWFYNTFIDDKTSHIVVYILKTKSEG